MFLTLFSCTSDVKRKKIETIEARDLLRSNTERNRELIERIRKLGLGKITTIVLMHQKVYVIPVDKNPFDTSGSSGETISTTVIDTVTLGPYPAFLLDSVALIEWKKDFKYVKENRGLINSFIKQDFEKLDQVLAQNPLPDKPINFKEDMDRSSIWHDTSFIANFNEITRELCGKATYFLTE